MCSSSPIQAFIFSWFFHLHELRGTTAAMELNNLWVTQDNSSQLLEHDSNSELQDFAPSTQSCSILFLNYNS